MVEQMIVKDKLQDAARQVIEREDVRLVLGYRKGTFGFRMRPAFVEAPEDVEQLTFTPACVNNLATYLTNVERPPLPRGTTNDTRTVAVMVKGCDTRAVMQQLAELAYPRDRVIILGIPCNGVVDQAKLDKRFPNVRSGDVARAGDDFVISFDGNTEKVPAAELLAEKCTRCRFPTPLLYDELLGEEVAPLAEDDYADVTEAEGRSSDEKWAYWEEKFSRCARCYACRNVCPMCYCDNCVLDRSNPQWMRRSVDISENTAYHISRAYHLAGRCIQCGECQRACPMDIPIMEMNRKFAKDVEEMYEYEPGLDAEAKPLLSTFQPTDSEDFIL